MNSYTSSQITRLDITLLDPHPDNPRKTIGDVTELAASITANGLLTPLSVVPHDGRYRVIAGHRRLAACKQAGLAQIPAFVLHLTPIQQLEAMITENTQREQLTVLEESDAIQGLLQLGATIPRIASQLGRSQTYVRERKRIARIPDGVRASRDDFGQLSFSELAALAEFDDDPDAQTALARVAGTDSFRWNLDRQRERRRDRLWRGEAERALAGLDVEALPESVSVSGWWATPVGWRAETRFEAGDVSFRDQWESWAGECDDVSGLFVRLFDDCAVVYRRDDAKADAESYEERRRREQREKRERMKPVVEFHERARRLRESWVGRHAFHLSADRLGAMVRALTMLDVFTERAWISLNGGLDSQDRDKAIESYNRIRERHPLPVTVKDPKAGVYHLYGEENYRELESRCAGSDAELACLLCAFCEARIDADDWTRAANPMVRGYYRLLETAGYPVSDEERSALADGVGVA